MSNMAAARKSSPNIFHPNAEDGTYLGDAYNNWGNAAKTYVKELDMGKNVVDTLVVRCIFKMSLWSVFKLWLLGVCTPYKQVSIRQQMIDAGIWDETHA